MKKYYLVEADYNCGKVEREYRRTSVFTGIGRVIGFALMFGGGFVIGQVLRGVIQGIMLLLGV